MHVNLVKSTELIANISQYNSMIIYIYIYIYICTILSILFTLARIHILMMIKNFLAWLARRMKQYRPMGSRRRKFTQSERCLVARDTTPVNERAPGPLDKRTGLAPTATWTP